MGVVGIHIHGLEGAAGRVSAKGRDPFEVIGYGDSGRKLSSIVRCYDPTGDNGKGRYDKGTSL